MTRKPLIDPMTRPDVTALAAAAHAVMGPHYDGPLGKDCESFDGGSALWDDFIAALAAAGWRITSEDEWCGCNWPKDGHIHAADDPASAQAVPDGRRQVAALIGQPALALIERAAVREALEGLRAEVIAAQGGEAWIEDVVLALIDARLGR